MRSGTRSARRTTLWEATPPALTRMRVIATGLLLAIAGLFLIARRLEPIEPAFGYLRAFTEAAMVGGLADWFAVTALFRHPLGLPIPHTAIVPRNKDRIGETLARFLRTNFLIPRVVARRMHRLDLATTVGRWLAHPQASQGRMRRGASRLAAGALESLDPERLGGLVRSGLLGQLRRLEVAPLVGQALQAAIAENRHLPLLDGTIRWACRILAANEHLIRAMVQERAGSVLRWTGLDVTLANKIIDGLDKLLAEMADDPDHPLRAKANDALVTLAHDLQHDAELRARMEGWKNDLLDNPALGAWWQNVWERARAALLRAVRNPERLLAGQLGEALRQLGETLQRDRQLATTVNRFARRAVVGVAADYGDAIVRLVSETVRGWDADTITRRMENAVGRDLQYIRINGTLVGGLVGLAIHLVDVII